MRLFPLFVTFQIVFFPGLGMQRGRCIIAGENDKRPSKDRVAEKTFPLFICTLRPKGNFSIFLRPPLSLRSRLNAHGFKQSCKNSFERCLLTIECFLFFLTLLLLRDIRGYS